MICFSELTFDLRRVLFDTRKIRRCFVNKKELLYTERYQIENIIFLYVRRKIKTENVVYHGCRYDHFDINYQNKYGNTALIRSSGYGYENMVKILIEAGADSNIQNRDGKTALISASIHKKKNMVKILLEAGADPNIRSKNGRTALYLASEYGYYNIVKILLEAGADPNIQNKWGRKALYIARKRGHKNSVSIILKARYNGRN